MRRPSPRLRLGAAGLLLASTLASARADDLPPPPRRTLRAGEVAGPVAREDAPRAAPLAPVRLRSASDPAAPVSSDDRLALARVAADGLEDAGPIAPARAPSPADDDDQGVPRLDAPAPRTAADDFDPTTWDPRLPPLGRPIAVRSRVSMRTDPVRGGSVQTFPIDAATTAVVMVGNPVIEGEDLLVKAETLVVWLDPRRLDALGLAGLSGGAGTPGPAAPTGAAPTSASRSVLPEAILAIYAEGAVDLVSEDVAFRASELFIDERSHRALLVEPRFDTSAREGPKGEPVPVHVRANRLKSLAEGFAVFEDAEVSTSRANDRIGLAVRVLTMEELAAAGSGPTLLGFRTTPGSQRFSARSLVGRAERVPLLYVPNAAFGGERGVSDFPFRLGLDTGSRSSLGRYAIVGVGRRIPVGADGHVDVTGHGGGYSRRGPAAGVEAEGRSGRGPRPDWKGRLETFAVYDLSGDDRGDYSVAEGLRGQALFEGRYEASRTLRVDAEASLFTDRGFYREFFESDERTHKDRETYARLRFLDGGVGGALTIGAHARDFKTETLEQPSVSLWSESLPLGETTGPIRLGFDLSSVASVARLARRFDLRLDDDGYEAIRADVSERVYAPFDAGDVRISPFVGARWTGYYDRTDGGPDVSRTALEAGVRANLQLHRDSDVTGGPWRLDGMRHVVDVDLGAFARRGDGSSPDDVPFFDRIDAEEDRSEVFLEVRNRIETRRVTGDRASGSQRRNATLVDLRVRGAWWPEEVGPYRRRGPGEISVWGLAELTPETAWIRGESVVALQGTTFRHSSLGVEWAPDDVFRGAVGVRHVQDEVLAPWFDAYARWNEKWAVRLSGIRDFDSGSGGNLRLSLLRFSEDHQLDVGFSLRDGGDVQLFVGFHPAIGGEPLSSPFEPREAIDYSP